LDYSDPEAPVLAVKVQEAFGWLETPRIGDGRVAVLLHLLSGAGVAPAGPQVRVDAGHLAGERVDELLPLVVAPGRYPAAGAAGEHGAEHPGQRGTVVGASGDRDPGRRLQPLPLVAPPGVPHVDAGTGLVVRVGPVLAGELAGGEVVGVAAPVAAVVVASKTTTSSKPPSQASGPA